MIEDLVAITGTLAFVILALFAVVWITGAPEPIEEEEPLEEEEPVEPEIVDAEGADKFEEYDIALEGAIRYARTPGTVLPENDNLF